MIPNKAITFLSVCIAATYNYISLVVQRGVSAYTEGVKSTVNHIPFFYSCSGTFPLSWLIFHSVKSSFCIHTYVQQFWPLSPSIQPDQSKINQKIPNHFQVILHIHSHICMVVIQTAAIC